MKKLLSLILALLLAGSLSACGGKQSAGSVKQEENGDGAGGRYKVALVQAEDGDGFAELRETFRTRLRDLGYDEARLSFDIRSAQGDPELLGEICEKLKNTKYDLIVPIGTRAARAVAAQKPGVPSVFIAVTDPVGAGLMTMPEKPDGNMTGSSDAVPPGEVCGLIKTLTPRVKRVGILYFSGDGLSERAARELGGFLTENDFACEEAAAENAGTAGKAARELAGRTDALCIPPCPALREALPEILKAAAAEKRPVYAGEPEAVRAGALACVYADREQLACLAAEMADKILSGTSVSEVPAAGLTEYRFVISEKTARALKVKIPSGPKYTVVE